MTRLQFFRHTAESKLAFEGEDFGIFDGTRTLDNEKDGID